MAQRILQFGTSRFLQAHADLFVHQARLVGQDIGPITVVKISPGAERAGRLAHLARPDGYPVIIRGLVQGQPVEESHHVTSITATLNAVDDWPRLVLCFVGQTEIVFSNVGETGYDIPAADRTLNFADPGIPTSFPGKLLALLAARFSAGGAPLLILPSELIANNGTVLRQTLTALATDWSAPFAFMEWLAGSVTLCNTLVDRIVPTALDPVGAIAEPYALWAIECPAGLTLPFSHPAIIPTADLEPYLRLKLHILNLGHTYLAEAWLTQARAPTETVREILSDPVMRPSLLSLYADEVIPGFATHGMEKAAQTYVVEVMDRFDNPFLAHPLRDIAQNHKIKIARRVEGFLDWVLERDAGINLPRLTTFAFAAKG